MAGTRVLVTGGSGRIGSALVNRLVAAGDRVRVVDMKPCSVKGAECIVASLNDPEALAKAMDGIEIVYHLAASIDYKASRGVLYKRNVETTKNVLRAAKGVRRVRQFIFMSTTSVYNESDGLITEETPPNPYSNYGWSKLECESEIKASGVPYTILRSSQVFGPQFKEGFESVLRHLQKGDMKIFGNGLNYIPLVHINDLVKALVLVKWNKKAMNHVFNVDGGYQKTQEEFLDVASNILGVAPPKKHLNIGLAKLLSRFTGKTSLTGGYIDKLAKNRPVSIGKIEKIGFEPGVGLEDGIRGVIDVFKEKGLIQ
jgi:UDP-glucose 4-epimerase